MKEEIDGWMVGLSQTERERLAADLLAQKITGPFTGLAWLARPTIIQIEAQSEAKAILLSPRFPFVTGWLVLHSAFAATAGFCALAPASASDKSFCESNLNKGWVGGALTRLAVFNITREGAQAVFAGRFLGHRGDSLLGHGDWHFWGYGFGLGNLCSFQQRG